MFKPSRVISGGGVTRPGFLGYYASYTDLPLVYNEIAVMAGDYAICGDTDTVWVWDTNESGWADTGQAINVNDVLLRNGTTSPNANISWAGYKLTNLGTATNSGDATNKTYVDTRVAGIAWKEPVSEIVSSVPVSAGSTGQRVAITDGTIYLFNGATWGQASAATIGNAFYCVNDVAPFFWDGTEWRKISNSSIDSGVVLSDGTVPLTDNWTVNSGVHTYQLKNVGSASDLSDATTLRDVNQVRVNMIADPVDEIEGALNPVTGLESKAVGYRYIRITDLKVCEKIASNEWLYTDSKEGSIVYDRNTNHYFYFNGTGWERLEAAIEPAQFDLSTLTLPHSQITGSEAADYHPQYLKVDNRLVMVTAGLSLKNSSRIVNLVDGVNPQDAVTYKQLSTVANGVTWQDPCVGLYNTPPTDGASIPRVIVGPNPTGVFADHANDIAYWTLPSGPWTFVDPSKGWACYLTDNGESVEGVYLNEANEQWIYNGESWVMFYGAMTHDQLVDAGESTIHVRYLRNDFPGEANGMITFSPGSSGVPFIVPDTHGQLVSNLNVDKVDGYDVSGTHTATNTIPLRNASGIIGSPYIEGTKIRAVNGFDASDRVSVTLDAGIETYTVGEHEYTDLLASITPYKIGETYDGIASKVFRFVDFDRIEVASGTFKIGNGTVITDLSSKWSDYITHAAFPLNLNGWSENYVLAYNGASWFATNPNDVSGTPHHALTELGDDDHTQYYNASRFNSRHDTTSAHALGSVVPHDSLNGLTDVTISSAADNQVLTYDNGDWVNKYVSAANYNHDDLSSVVRSVKHAVHPLLDGSRMFHGNLNIRTSASYTNPLTGSPSSGHEEDMLNSTINLGVFNGKLHFEDYAMVNEYGGYAGSLHGVMLSHGGQSLHFGKLNNNSGSATNFKVITSDGTLFNLVHGDGTYGSTTFTADGWNVYHRGSARVSGTEPTEAPSVGGAIVGLNAQYIQGKTLDDIEQGGAIKHSTLRELVVTEGDATEVDDHTQYFNATRHNTTSAHTLGSVVPHDSLNGLTDVVISNPGNNDVLLYSGGQWSNSNVSLTVAHDSTSGAAASTVHTKYIRNDIKQTLTSGHLDFANPIWITVDNNPRYVPFTLNGDVTFSGAIPNLNADMVDGLHGSDLVQIASANVFTGVNTFASTTTFNEALQLPDTSILDWATDPEGTGLPSNRELFISAETGILMYRWDGNTYWVATKDGAIEGTSESCFHIDLRSANGGVRLCNNSGLGIRIGNSAGDLSNVYAKDYYCGGVNFATYNAGTVNLVNVSVDHSDVVFPSGSNGQYLKWNGSAVEFATVDALPSQSGNNGKYLTTDGTAASWVDVDALPDQSGNSGKYLTTDGTTASWATVSGGSGGGAFAIVGNATQESGTTTVVVTHNYGTIPDWIDLVPDANISDVTATTFTVSTLYPVENAVKYRWRVMGAVAVNNVLDGGTFS